VISIKDETLGSKDEPKVLVKKGTLPHERRRTAVGIVNKPGRRRS
jgi:hypothetical protein